jgi:hypothetical protein
LRKHRAHSSTTRNSTRLSGAARAREAEHTAGATETENRQALHVAAQAQPLHQQGIEARRGNAGGGDDDDRVDGFSGKSGLIETGTGDLFEQRDGVVEINAVAFLPASVLVVPFDGHAGIARLDAGIFEHRQQMLDFVAGTSKETSSPRPHVRLVQRIRRYCGCESEQARLHHDWRPSIPVH